MKRKKLLSLGLALVMSLSLAVPAMAAEDEAKEPEVTPYVVSEDVKGKTVILHSNDVHGAVEGYAKMAALKAQFEAAGANVLVMDAGDFSQGETYVSASQGATAIELMNMVGYDVAAPGNHEFDYGYENLTKLAEAAEFPILAANITCDDKLAFGDHVVLEAGDMKVGVFGLDTPETASKAHPAKIAGVKFAGGKDMYAVAEEQVKALEKEKVDVIVALCHLGIDEETAATANRSIDMLEKVKGIDVLIDGHSHSTQEEIATATNDKRTVNGAVVTSTGTKFANIGVVTIDAKGKITTECVDTKAITVAEDDAVLARAQAIQAEIEAEYGAAFAKSEVELNGAKAPGNRTQETNNGDLICDAMLWFATKEDLGVPAENVVALTNGGGIRAAIKAGDISKNDVNTVLPFGNTVAVDYVTGAVLLEALEASTFCTPEAIGGFPQVAGIEFTIDTTKAFDKGEQYGDTTYFAPKSINRVTIDNINGKKFDPKATYAVVTNDFVAAGGDTYYALSVSDRITDTGVPLDEAVMQYITEVLDGVITAEKYGEPAGRITVIDVLDSFKDVDQEAWYAEAVRSCVKDEVMIGTNKGFEPEGTVTKATVLQTLFNRDGGEKTDNKVWYADAAKWAETNGLVESADFKDEVITRAETAQFLAAYCELKEWEAKAGETTVDSCADFDTIVDDDEVKAVTYCFDAGIMVGGNGSLMPTKTLTRAEFAQILVNLNAFETAQAAEEAPAK